MLISSAAADAVYICSRYVLSCPVNPSAGRVRPAILLSYCPAPAVASALAVLLRVCGSGAGCVAEVIRVSGAVASALRAFLSSDLISSGEGLKLPRSAISFQGRRCPCVLRSVVLVGVSCAGCVTLQLCGRCLGFRSAGVGDDLG